VFFLAKCLDATADANTTASDESQVLLPLSICTPRCFLDAAFGLKPTHGIAHKIESSCAPEHKTPRSATQFIL
jgi:hypothetical protein